MGRKSSRFFDIMCILGIMLLVFVWMVLVYFALNGINIDIKVIFLLLAYIIFLIFGRIVDWWSPNFVNRELNESFDLMKLRVEKESQLSLFSFGFAITLIITGITTTLTFSVYILILGMIAFVFSSFHWLYHVQARYKKLEDAIIAGHHN